MEGKRELLSLKEAAEFLSIKKSTIYNWIHHDCSPVTIIRIGATIRFDKEDLVNLINKQRGVT